MLVYHGTTPQLGKQFIDSGIDAHIPYRRAIHGPQDNYAGIFVTPKLSVARRFGLCVIAIDVDENLLTVPPNLVLAGATLEQSLNHHFEPQAFISTRIEPSCIALVECHENGRLLNTYAESIKDITSDAINILNTENARMEIQLLLQHALNVNRAWLISHENDALQPNNHAVFEALVRRRLNGEPIAYILGCREFYGLKLKVTPDTLIPRPDTETLVEAALARIPQNQTCKILDLGTGTGAIALAIAKHRSQAFVTATDASEYALSVAKENAENLGITNITFVHSNWFSALNAQRFDMIVSNPPYIEQDDKHLNQGDLRFEPLFALASGIDGLDDIKQIISTAPQHLNPYGWLMLEHGYNQAGSIAALMKEAGFSQIETIKDLGVNDRVTLGCLA